MTLLHPVHLHGAVLRHPQFTYCVIRMATGRWLAYRFGLIKTPATLNEKMIAVLIEAGL